MPGMDAADDFLKDFFGSQKERYVVDHVLREVGKGRPLDAVLADPYVTNRLDERERRAILDSPEVSAAVSAEVLDDLRATLGR